MKVRLAILILILPLVMVTFVQAATPVSENAKSSQYKEECSSCHIAYPAWLLPARSWNRIMTNLSNHFGDNASLEPEARKIISQYLQENSADKSHSRRIKKFQRSIEPGNIPMRITELPYFKREHHEIPSRLVKANPRVKSLSNCQTCHQGAERGSFSEHQIRIPGYGRWDD